MIDRGKILGLIPARGGSKGVPGKNIRACAGRPLIGWTIAAAKESRYIDDVVLSSDDPAIIEYAATLGCAAPFRRPPELAQDDTPIAAAIIHALTTLTATYEYFVLLQPTSPLRLAIDIDACLEQCHAMGAPAALTVTPAEPSPYLMYRLDEQKHMAPVIERNDQRRQDLPPIHTINGAVYVGRCEWYLKNRSFLSPETVASVMPAERSIDIDTEIDFALANVLLERRA